MSDGKGKIGSNSSFSFRYTPPTPPSPPVQITPILNPVNSRIGADVSGQNNSIGVSTGLGGTEIHGSHNINDNNTIYWQGSRGNVGFGFERRFGGSGNSGGSGCKLM
jgi:hypothetical protein